VVGGKASMSDELANLMGATRYGKYKTRQDVVDAYLQIDVQVICRGRDRPLKNALKIINAASFGIPTIAYPEMGYEEMAGYYWPATTPDEVRAALWMLQTRGYQSERLVAKAEEYHIEHIAEMYEGL